MKTKAKQAAAPSNSLPVNLEGVERILEFMSQHGLEEFEYETEHLRIRLKRLLSGSNSVAARSAATAAMAPSPAPAPAEPSMESGPASSPGPQAALEAELHVIKSPIVGTFYSAPGPGADPFVRVGDVVRAGQVLCIIEAMKLMNEIESDAAGQIIKIHVENGQPVEYGEPLFSIRPSVGA